MRLSILVALCLSITGIYGYTAVGNKIKDPTGALVTIRGVDRPSFEWNANGEQASLSDYSLMSAWGANVVRIALNQQFWLSSSTYATTIDQQVAWANGVGLGVILDLHWNDNNGQQNMADSRSITFWSQVAARYKNNAWVMFELYNEPHDVSWSTWLSGDSTYAGMQQLYNAVRAAGANNLCIVGGLNWAFDLSGVSSGYAVVGTNIAYATHPYDFAGKQQANWPEAFGNLASTYPVIMTEFGQYCASNTYVSDLLTYAESNGIHWTAWAWYVSDCSFPSIIADWNGTPTPGVGELVKRYLSGKAPTVGPTQAPSSSGSSGTSSSQASSAMVVYTDTLASGWQDWSWSTSYSIADTTYVHSGSKSIKFELVGYQGVYYRSTSSFSIGLYSQIVFFVNGGTSTKAAGLVNVKVYGTAGTQVGNAVPLTAAATANQWTQITIPISSFGLPSSTSIVGIVIQSTVSNSAGFIWCDDISFVPSGISAPTSIPTAAPTAPPTLAPTSAPTSAPTAAPTLAPTSAPTAAPTIKPTSAPTLAPTSAPTVAPTIKPTLAPTSAPTVAPTTKPTLAPTLAPTAVPTSAPTSAPTAKPTTIPTTAPTTRPTGSCGASSVYFVQTVAGSWQSGAQTVTQYSLEIHNTCSSKKLVGLTLTPSNWNTVNFWNIESSGSSLSLPSYASISSATPFVVGYQSASGQASFTVASVTFE